MIVIATVARLTDAFQDWKEDVFAAKTTRRPLPIVSLGEGFLAALDWTHEHWRWHCGTPWMLLFVCACSALLADCQTAGCAGFCSKLDALLWVLRLETGRDHFESYTRSCISMLSDQGWLYLMFESSKDGLLWFPPMNKTVNTPVNYGF